MLKFYFDVTRHKIAALLSLFGEIISEYRRRRSKFAVSAFRYHFTAAADIKPKSSGHAAILFQRAPGRRWRAISRGEIVFQSFGRWAAPLSSSLFIAIHQCRYCVFTVVNDVSSPADMKSISRGRAERHAPATGK